MVEMSLGSFIAAMIVGVLIFSGVAGAATGVAKIFFVALLILSLGSMVLGIVQWWRSRKHAARAASDVSA